MKEIAVLVACHNRKVKTIKCLNSLYKAIAKNKGESSFEIYLVDDGSTDGTSEEVAKNFPKVIVVQGSGDLYWAGGMRLAWETALSANPNFDSFLLINDDVVFQEDFLFEIMKTHTFCLQHYNQSGIYVGSTQTFNNSKISYGGTLIQKKGLRVKSTKINPSNVPVPCSMANGNILMVTKDVVDFIGIIDPNYTHLFADYDYTLTASRKGIPVLVCPGVGGYCENDTRIGWLSSGTPLKDRIKFLYSLNGLSYKEQLYYLKKNFKYQLPYYFTMLWLKTLFPFVWDTFKKESDFKKV
jgi:GT2 family glycosyltransferase